MSKEFKGTVTIAGNTYSCEVRNGIRYIAGLTVEEFMDGLTSPVSPFHRTVLEDMAQVGAHALRLEKAGKTSENKELQRHANALHSARVN